jgi:methionyl-tRNA synthetase
LNELEEYPSKVAKLFENYKFKDAVLEIMNLARNANKYFNDSEPWKTVKSDKGICATTINISLQTIYTLAEILSPVIPFSSERIFKMLNSKPTEWRNCGKDNLETGLSLNKPEILFQKIEDEIINIQLEKLPKNEELKDEKNEEISFEEFAKIKLKVAEIITAEKIDKSDKLLKLKVKVGISEKQIIAGIAKSYKLNSLVNKKVIIVSNLKPAKLFGQLSEGMVLAVEDTEGHLNLLEVNETIISGTQVR